MTSFAPARSFLRFTLAAAALLAPVTLTHAQAISPYQDRTAPLEARVSDLFGKMTQDEKLSFLTGTGFTTQPILRLGVPAMAMADAGSGVRGGPDDTTGPATAFPCGVCVASSWDRDLIGRVGQAIGMEALNKGPGVEVMLGPAVNIHRSPLGGRNSEYMSEDPYLASQMVVPYILGMQSTGAGACVKHFACNNEEVDRGEVDVRVGDRALREIYLPAFEAAVREGHVWTIMSSYNRINGYHATANWYLLTEILKNEWGFDGLVMSDWGAVHATGEVVNAGNDLEMPGPGLVTHDKLAKALRAGTVRQEAIDDSVKRILRTVIRVGLLDGTRTPDAGVVDSPEHQRLAKEAAEKGMVLLKNEGGILPLDAAKLQSIAVIGPRAKNWQFASGGSPTVTPYFSVSGYQGIVNRAGDRVKINYASASDLGSGSAVVPESALSPDTDSKQHGLRGQYFDNTELKGKPVATRTDPQLQFQWDSSQRPKGIGETKFSVRWTGKLTAPATGSYTFALAADDGCRLVIDGKTIIDHWIDSGGAPVIGKIDLVAGRQYDIRVDYYQGAGGSLLRLNWILPGGAQFPDAIAAAKKSDVAIVFVGSQNEGEGSDRSSMALDGVQAELVHAVAAANKNTIVVLNNGAPVLMADWLPKVPGVVEAWLPGEEGGDALAAILFGDVNPSGKLTDTIAARREDYPDFGNFPGVKNVVHYDEGIYVGYRHFDKKQVAPIYPFGYGLSYTTFKYSNIKIATPELSSSGQVTVTADITNTGQRAGSEIAELYVHDPSPKIDKPVRELKGFAKIALQPGETKTATFTLTPRDLAYCDVAGKQWKADGGNYEVEVGASSRDLPLKTDLRLTSDWTQSVPGMGIPAPPMVKPSLATGKPVLASSIQSGEDTPPEYAVDGDSGTRWSSAPSDPQWIAVDLGAPTTVARVNIVWEAAYASAYDIQVSDDGQDWKTVYSTTKGQGDLETISFAPVKARWVRMLGKKRATQFGYSLYSFDVFGEKG
ncbi:beta-glucosidase [Capsulimonas corticalis]|uniref:Beta-glucosidase n=1 Tax=Capsulimonas corticalis TaxID=2219043 RepID=A0A402CVK5_9BACT|nr:glycoside hydrolase family 3 C-terminal domain-containing protein [Capsulimonas corticalis]BDI30435.1 beta-glucosidase [Capsulimonas corticalis]